MRNLLRFEFRKLFRSASFYICGGLAVLVVILPIVFMGLTFTEDALTTGLFDGYTGLLRMKSAVSDGELVLFLSIFLSIFICKDYGEGSVRLVISRGYSRIKIILSRWIVSMSASLMIAVCMMIAGFSFASAFFGVGEGFDGYYLLAILEVLLVVITYTTFFVFFAAWVRKLALAIVGGVLTPIIVPLLAGVIDVSIQAKAMISGNLDAMMNSDLFQLSPYLLNTTLSDLNSIGNRSLSQTLSDLFSAMQSEPADPASILCHVAIIAACYLAVFFGLMLLTTRRQEV